MSIGERYAIFYAPEEGGPLWDFGMRWLGRHVVTGELVPLLECQGISPLRHKALTATPAHYGFHGTLKAPFRLPGGTPTAALVEAAAEFAKTQRPISCGPLALARLGRFLALMPGGDTAALDALAADCVRIFDAFRAPAAAEQATYAEKSLSARQRRLLEAWGYPYVMEEFRFHLTLTDNVDADEESMLRRVLAPHVEPLCQDAFVVTSICLFRQPRRDAPFVLDRRFPFGG